MLQRLVRRCDGVVYKGYDLIKLFVLLLLYPASLISYLNSGILLALGPVVTFRVACFSAPGDFTWIGLMAFSEGLSE